MKTAASLVIAGSLISANASALVLEDFEDGSVSYTTSEAEFSDGAGDFWTRTDGSTIGTFVEYGNVSGSSFFAGMDLDGEGATLPLVMNFNAIDISGYAGIGFSVLLAEDDDDDDQDWDETDYVSFEAQVDGGGYSEFMRVVGQDFTSGGGPFNGIAAVNGVEVTSSFAEFSSLIAGTGSRLDLRITWQLNAGDEDLAIDDVSISNIPEPASAALLGLGTLLIARRRR